ncbi:MAG: carboxylesterase/lipase family protein [Candidatus Hydrogenedentes bacterium]|jgi:para-nitrobenzyl esterase|nr:carboxylesterase/lipase family protein [Candidatus Hydrogenedentota bacterium]
MAIVQTEFGGIEGVEENGLSVFKGIPFAQPPTGSLRFRPPEPPQPWTGTFPATEFGAAPPQLAGESSGESGAGISEDCLTVNVWTPGCDATARPVMVWIYGGSFVMGSNSSDVSDGATLAANGDVVVVSLNYRVGAFGFLHLTDIAGEDFASSCNLGLLDQIAALQWVQQNISAFGGDSDNVTVFGVSAGGISISALLAMPAAKGLFHKAITQSGAANQVRSEASAATASRYVRKFAGARTLEDLQALSMEEILKAQKKALRTSPKPDAFFGPVVDGTLLPEPPLHAIRGGRSADVPLMTGTNLDEMRFWLTHSPEVAKPDPARLMRAVEKMLGGSADALVKAYESRFPEATETDRRISILSDLTFTIPAIRMLEAHEERQSKVWLYLFTWESPAYDGMLGSPHAIEQPFVFGTLESSFATTYGVNGAECLELSRRVQDAWIAFARHGDPSHDGLPSWPDYSHGARKVMVFDTQCECKDDPHGAVRPAWDAVPFDGIQPPVGVRPMPAEG